MHNLIIQRNMNKRATEEDGPSFEQQFGILANAVVTDKFPQLDSMKLAFQLIDKEDDNSKACGAGIYVIGKSVVFVPAFFLNGNIKTADMMLLADTQQFLPMSDPWIGWIKTKDITQSGELIDDTEMGMQGSTKGTTIRYISDPIIKAASAYMKGLCKLDPDLKKTASDMNVLDTALHMGKEATASMLDNLMKTDMLNATLSFYAPDKIQKFASVASTMDPAPAFKVIMPFDKEAKDLTAKEQSALYKDGFFIKCAAESKEVPTVIRKKKIQDMFGVVRGAGKAEMLQPDGTLKEAYVFKSAGDLCCCDSMDSSAVTSVNSYTANRDNHYPPLPEKGANRDFIIIVDDKPISVAEGVMESVGKHEDFNEDNFKEVGTAMSDMGNTEDGGYILTPDGAAFYVWRLEKAGDDTWQNGGTVYQLAERDSTLRKPMGTSGNMIILPAKSRFVKNPSYKEKGPAIRFVTMGILDSFIESYTQKHYKKARIYNNGSDYTVSGDNSKDGDKLLTMKEAALKLVEDYGVTPADAKVMLKDASNGATYDRPRATQYLITKVATLEDGKWEDSNIPHTQYVNQPPQISQDSLPTIVEDPEQLEQAVTNAAQQGIKEVFDVTVLKLLVKQNHFFDEIHDDLPIFMRVLDSLCRKLFQFYWHTEKMEEKYGMTKLKSLEESLKVTLDSLSELTIFFKLRTVDGTGSTGDTVGELMTGDMR